MSIKKFYAKATPSCKVTFSLANEIAASANHANLAGDFNNWNTESIPMKKSKNGKFSVSIDLEKGREYQFKYFIDGNTWKDELEADNHVPNEFEGTNSVISI